MKEEAVKKLEEEKKKGKYDRYAGAMKDAVCAKLADFCRQDEEFAQAVVQGGTFEECMKAVAEGCGSSLSDLDAYTRAVRFYFPGAEIRCTMTVDLAGAAGRDEAEPEPETQSGKLLHLDLDRFLL